MSHTIVPIDKEARRQAQIERATAAFRQLLEDSLKPEFTGCAQLHLHIRQGGLSGVRRVLEQDA